MCRCRGPDADALRYRDPGRTAARDILHQQAATACAAPTAWPGALPGRHACATRTAERRAPSNNSAHGRSPPSARPGRPSARAQHVPMTTRGSGSGRPPPSEARLRHFRDDTPAGITGPADDARNRIRLHAAHATARSGARPRAGPERAAPRPRRANTRDEILSVWPSTCWAGGSPTRSAWPPDSTRTRWRYRR